MVLQNYAQDRPRNYQTYEAITSRHEACQVETSSNITRMCLEEKRGSIKAVRCCLHKGIPLSQVGSDHCSSSLERRIGPSVRE